LLPDSVMVYYYRRCYSLSVSLSLSLCFFLSVCLICGENVC
jgi:hypothetical protein